MAIGVPGGFDPSRRDFKIDKVFAVVALEPSGQPHRFELPAALASLPPAIRASAEGLMAHESAAESDQLEAWTQERQVRWTERGAVSLTDSSSFLFPLSLQSGGIMDREHFKY